MSLPYLLFSIGYNDSVKLSYQPRHVCISMCEMNIFDFLQGCRLAKAGDILQDKNKLLLTHYTKQFMFLLILLVYTENSMLRAVFFFFNR